MHTSPARAEFRSYLASNWTILFVLAFSRILWPHSLQRTGSVLDSDKVAEHSAQIYFKVAVLACEVPAAAASKLTGIWNPSRDIFFQWELDNLCNLTDSALQEKVNGVTAITNLMDSLNVSVTSCCGSIQFDAQLILHWELIFSFMSQQKWNFLFFEGNYFIQKAYR